MPTPTINFLRQRRKQLTSVQSLDKRYAMVLGYVFVGVLIVTGVLFGVDYWLSNRLSSVKSDQQRVQRQITNLASVEQEYLTLAQKVSAIKGLIKDKAVKQQAIEFFTTLFAQQNVTLSELTFLEDGVIQFQVESKDVFQFKELLAVLESPQVRAVYPQIAVNDLSRVKSAQYGAAISVKLAVATPSPKPKPTVRPTSAL